MRTRIGRGIYSGETGWRYATPRGEQWMPQHPTWHHASAHHRGSPNHLQLMNLFFSQLTVSCQIIPTL